MRAPTRIADPPIHGTGRAPLRPVLSGPAATVTVPGDTPFAAHLFGPFRIVRHRERIEDRAWRRSHARSLLQWFLLHPGTPMAQDELCRLIWADRSPESSARSLHVALHHVRRALEPDLPPRSASSYIRRAADRCYTFEPGDDWWIDVTEVETLHREAADAERRNDAGLAIDRLARLAALHDAGFLPEAVYDDLFDGQRYRFEVAHIDVLQRLARLYLAVGHTSSGLTCGLRMLAVDPYNDDAISLVVEAFLRQGNPFAARRYLDQYVDAIVSELGAGPTGRMKDLRERIVESL